MKNMTLENIARACHGTLYLADGVEKPEQEASAVVIDSRKVTAGSVFVAVRGERVDGHAFIPGAFEDGAIAAVCEALPEHSSGPCILVQDTLRALKNIGEFYRKQLPAKVVGITGSVGKTSTKEFIAGVLAQKFKVHKTQGNFNNEIGVPLTLLAAPDDTEVIVLEMGINHFGEMHRLSRMARPDICVMTNIGQCHLEFLGSREGILKAKSEIFDYMDVDGKVCVNGDDDMLATIREAGGKKPFTFGMKESGDAFATDIVNLGLRGSEALLHVNGSVFHARVPLPGIHMVYNALAAAQVGTLFGMETAEIAAGIASVEAVSGRSRVISLEDKVLIDDCYNANPVSMEAAIDLLNLAVGRKVAILGDMFELGEEELALHAGVGRYAAEHGVDCLICAGTLSEAMAAAAKEAGLKEVHHFADREALLGELPQLLKAQDSVLIKASHGMGYEKIVKNLTE